MAAKERWSSGDVPAARRLLADAFSANPDSEAIWLAAFKLEFESGEVERARAILKKARETTAAENGSEAVGGGGDTPRVWMKAAIVERRAGDAAAERQLLDQAVKRFPTFDKLHLMRGQLSERERDWSGARRAYAAGLARCPGSVPLWVSAARLEERAAAAAASSDGGGPGSSGSGSSSGAGSSRARALLEQARLRNPASDALWLAAVRTEARAAGLWARARDAGVSASGAAAAGLSGAAASLLAKALQACPHSGRLWAEAILTAPRPSRRSTSVDALKKCNDDPHVVSAVAALFAADRKPDKARSWFERAVRLDPDCGDHWARYYLFESEHAGGGGGAGGADAGSAAAGATASAAQAVLARCVAAAPRHGERWTRVSKDPRLEHLKAGELLPLVAEDVANEPPP
jgi:pre-mRNA-processing factor 6